MVQHYTNTAPQSPAMPVNKVALILLACISLTFAVYTAYINKAIPLANAMDTPLPAITPQGPPSLNDIPGLLRTDSVGTVVAKALYFKSLLTSAQISTLEQTYTTTLARKWSNLPCGSGCRNGIQLGSLTAVQLAAALDVIKAASGTVANEGYDEFAQIRLADKYLGLNGGGSGYDSTIYFLAFLNTPSNTGAWMLQYGGHHYAANIAFNAGKVVGTTPNFMGIEPRAFTINSVTYAPLKQERDSFIVMLASLTAAQLATAKLSTTFSDVTMSPGETNGGNGTFPTTKVGLQVSTLSTAQKNLVTAAIRNYTRDVDDSAGAVLQAIYASEIDGTYIAWTGSGTAGDSSTFLNANTNYVRIDGPSVWIEFVCQNGVVLSGIHYHTVYRDHYRDYGLDLTRTSLPLGTLSFDVRMANKQRQLYWNTANEQNVAYFSVERSTDATRGFTTIGKVNAANTATASYIFNDKEALTSSVVYYRLKVVDKDGLSQYSKVVSIKNKDAGGLSIYPNPVVNSVSVVLSESMKSGAIRVVNSLGKTVLSLNNQGGTKVDIDISMLTADVYTVQVNNGGIISSASFVKQLR
jgi:hypothetical protein